MARKVKPKFNWEEFLRSSRKMVIHCETEKETEKCLALLKAHGISFKWSSLHYWSDFGKNLCFSNQRSYHSINKYNRDGTQIFKFSSYDFEERTENGTS